MIKYNILVQVDRSGYGKVILVCAATGHRTLGLPMSPTRFPTHVDMAAKAVEWATTRRNIDPATVCRDVTFKIAA